MSPRTVTTMLQTTKKCFSQKHLNSGHERKEQKDAYDLVLPKNEPKYMAPVRRWEKSAGFRTPIMWISALCIVSMHMIAVLWFCYNFWNFNLPKWQTVLFSFMIGGVSGFGVTAGAHRLWCHRSYKAKKPLQIILLICYSVAGQNTVYDWVRDHRVHHKYSETSADPHDSNRGFFFAHVGWLMMKKHPEVRRVGAKIDMTDITNDALLMFHNRHFIWFKIIFCFILPTVVLPLMWNESWGNAVLSQLFLRYLSSLNFTWAVNSFAHIWGYRPYDRFIKPVENWGVSLVAMGEGWHNYHHTFPWDYKAAELGYGLNLTTLILDIFAKIGWAYDLKEASPVLVKTVAENRGDKDKHS